MSACMSVCFAHSLVCLLFILLIRFCLGYCRLSPFFKPTPVTSSVPSQTQQSLWLSKRLPLHLSLGPCPCSWPSALSVRLSIYESSLTSPRVSPSSASMYRLASPVPLPPQCIQAISNPSTSLPPQRLCRYLLTSLPVSPQLLNDELTVETTRAGPGAGHLRSPPRLRRTCASQPLQVRPHLPAARTDTRRGAVREPESQPGHGRVSRDARQEDPAQRSQRVSSGERLQGRERWRF